MMVCEFKKKIRDTVDLVGGIVVLFVIGLLAFRLAEAKEALLGWILCFTILVPVIPVVITEFIKWRMGISGGVSHPPHIEEWDNENF